MYNQLHLISYWVICVQRGWSCRETSIRWCFGLLLMPSGNTIFCFLRHLTDSYLLSGFAGFSHTPLQSSLAGSCWSGAPERRQTQCTYEPLDFHVDQYPILKLPLRLEAGCLYPGRAQTNKLLLQARLRAGLLNCIFLKAKLEGRRHKQFGDSIKSCILFSR